MKNFTKNLRSTSICLITAAAIALPSVGHAGWFSEAKPEKKITRTVKASPGNVQAKIQDISGKLNEIYGQVNESRPLIDAMKNGKMMNNLKDIIVFLNQSQDDYQQFAHSGIHNLSQDMTGLLYGFGDMGRLMKLGNGLEDRLTKANDLLGKLPPQLMYVLDKAIGSTIAELSEDISALTEKLEIVASLPSNREMLTDPETYRGELCPLTNDRTVKVTYSIIMARLKLLAVKLDYVNEMIPSEITVTAVAVGGGGTSVPNPTKAISQTIKMIGDSMIQRLENADDIATTICEVDS